MFKIRRATRCTSRRLARRNLRPRARFISRNPVGKGRGPDELSQALAAFRRAIRAHRRLAKLSPEFFDSAVVDREARERAEQRRLMESFEPLLEKYYGPASESQRLADAVAQFPALPGPRTRRVVERELASLEFWLAIGHRAMDRYQQRRLHALPTLSQTVSLLTVALALGRLAAGIAETASESPLPQRDFEAELKRAYGQPRPASLG